MTIVEMQVTMDCPGCEEKIRKSLNKLEGVHDVHIDMNLQKVTVCGFVNERKVLKTVRKTKKMAHIWQHQPLNHYYNNFDEYQYNHQLNYRGAGNSYYYNPQPTYLHRYKQGILSRKSYELHHHQPSYSEMVEDNAISMFSDDNVNACSIM